MKTIGERIAEKWVDGDCSDHAQEISELRSALAALVDAAIAKDIDAIRRAEKGLRVALREEFAARLREKDDVIERLRRKHSAVCDDLIRETERANRAQEAADAEAQAGDEARKENAELRALLREANDAIDNSRKDCTGCAYIGATVPAAGWCEVHEPLRAAWMGIESKLKGKQ